MSTKLTTLLSSALLTIVLSTSVFFYYPASNVFAQETSQAGLDQIDAQAAADSQAASDSNTDVKGSCGVNAVMDFLTDQAASAVMGFFSTEVPTTDQKAQLNITRADLKACITAIKNIAIKVALAKMKKRLLDRLTDDTISWISGKDDGKPKFITNFGGVLQDSADAALGDTLRAAGMGKLCSDRLSFQVQVSLRKQRTFSEGVTCTLTGAAKNVSAFADNFKTGGWLGYGQLLEPSNNRWGLELLAKDALDAKTMKAAEATKLKSQSSAGYKATEYCKAWTLTGVHKTEGYGEVMEITRLPAEMFSGGLRSPENPPDPTDQPGESDYYPPDFPGSYSGLGYTCVQDDRVVSTPSTVISAAGNTALTSDWNSIASMDDLTPYITAIFDAGINRLKKEGVAGLQSASKNLFSRSGAGKGPMPAGTSTADRIYIGGNKGDTKSRINGELLLSAKDSYDALQNNVDDAQALIATALSQNSTSTDQMQILMACQNSLITPKLPVTDLPFRGCPNATTTLYALGQSAVQVAQFSSELAGNIARMGSIQAVLNSSKPSQADITSAMSAIQNISSRVVGLLSGAQNVIDTTTPKASQILTELNKCAAAAKTNSLYSCPAW